MRDTSAWRCLMVALLFVLGSVSHSYSQTSEIEEFSGEEFSVDALLSENLALSDDITACLRESSALDEQLHQQEQVYHNLVATTREALELFPKLQQEVAELAREQRSLALKAAEEAVEAERLTDEIDVHVTPNEPTAVVFPGLISGGFKAKRAAVAIARSGNIMVVYAHSDLKESGEPLLVILNDGSTVALRVLPTNDSEQRDVQVTLRLR